MKKAILEKIKDTINFVKPDNLIKKNVFYNEKEIFILNNKYDISNRNVHLIGAGKGSVLMAKALEEILQDKIAGGVIISNFEYTLKKTEVVIGNHPYPSLKNIESTKKLLNYIKSIPKKDLIIFLLSGGASALLEYPEEGLDIKQFKAITEKLMNMGMNIKELNSIRKKLSKVKNGKLLNYIKNELIVLVLSDVVGDDLSTIGSAPLYYTENDVSKILNKYKLEKVIDSKLLNLLKRKDKSFTNPPHFIIGSNKIAVNYLAEKFKQDGYKTLTLTSNYQGDAETLGLFFAGIYSNIKHDNFPLSKPAVVIAGGESTVKVIGKGKGGRNQHLVLSFLNEISSFEKDEIFLSFGTDGIDGPTDAAGALVNSELIDIAKKMNIDAQEYLSNCNSYEFFEKTNGLIKTGPTGTNVCDITLLITGNLYE